MIVLATEHVSAKSVSIPAPALVVSTQIAELLTTNQSARVNKNSPVTLTRLVAPFLSVSPKLNFSGGGKHYRLLTPNSQSKTNQRSILSPFFSCLGVHSRATD